MDKKYFLIFIFTLAVIIAYYYVGISNKIESTESEVLCETHGSKKSDCFGLWPRNDVIASRVYEAKQSKKLFINQKEFKFEVADSLEKRIKGLSGRNDLGDADGLLFIFEQEDFHSIWMKDMLFPIDVIWLNGDGKIIYVVENMKPESFPETFTPSEPAKYVLETKSGFVKENGIELRDMVNF